MNGDKMDSVKVCLEEDENATHPCNCIGLERTQYIQCIEVVKESVREKKR